MKRVLIGALLLAVAACDRKPAPSSTTAPAPDIPVRPKPPPWGLARPEDAQRAKEAREILARPDGWDHVDRLDKDHGDAPASTVVALAAEIEATTDDRLALALVLTLRTRVDSASEPALIQRVYDVAVPRLERILSGDTDSAWRRRAVKALAIFPPKLVGRTIFALYRRETDAAVKADLYAALERRASRDFYKEALDEYLKSPPDRTRVDLARVLVAINRCDPADSWMGDAHSEIAPRLNEVFFAAEAGSDLGVSCARVLAGVKSKSVNDMLIEDYLKEGPDENAQLKAAGALGVTGKDDTAIVERLHHVLGTAPLSETVKKAVLAAIKKIGE